MLDCTRSIRLYAGTLRHVNYAPFFAMNLDQFRIVKTLEDDRLELIVLFCENSELIAQNVAEERLIGYVFSPVVLIDI